MGQGSIVKFYLFSLVGFSVGYKDAITETENMFEMFQRMESEIRRLSQKIQMVEHDASRKIGLLTSEMQRVRDKCSCCKLTLEERTNSTSHTKMTRLLHDVSAPGTKVAFSVVLTHDMVLNDNQPISFDKVISNEGNAYHLQDQNFMAPTKGLYLLSFTIVNKMGQQQAVEMVRNGVQIVSLYGAGDNFNMGSQTVIIVLEKNDTVWVRRYRLSGSAPVIGRPNELYNTFSGVLLYEM